MAAVAKRSKKQKSQPPMAGVRRDLPQQQQQLFMLTPEMLPPDHPSGPAGTKARCRACGQAQHSETDCNVVENNRVLSAQFVQLHRNASENVARDWERRGFEQAYLNIRRCYRCLLWDHDELTCRTPPSRIDELRANPIRLLSLEKKPLELPPDHIWVPPSGPVEELPPPIKF